MTEVRENMYSVETNEKWITFLYNYLSFKEFLDFEVQ